jgi:hypothetical protein
MSLFDRIAYLINALLAALLVTGCLLCLGWIALLVMSQLAWWAFSGSWAPVVAVDLLRALPGVPESWPLTLVPSLPAAAQSLWDDPALQPVLSLPWVVAGLRWIGQWPLSACLLACATAMAWISSDLRCANMRLRRAARHRSRTPRGRALPASRASATLA